MCLRDGELCQCCLYSDVNELTLRVPLVSDLPAASVELLTN